MGSWADRLCKEIEVLDEIVYFDNVLFSYTERLSINFERSSRGLRQDDFLSPFLFNVVMEALSRLVFKAMEYGSIQGCVFP